MRAFHNFRPLLAIACQTHTRIAPRCPAHDAGPRPWRHSTEEIIANNVLQLAHDLGSFLDDGLNRTTQNLNVSAGGGSLGLNFTASSQSHEGLNMWTQLRATHAEAGTATSNLIAGYVGAHKFLRDDLLVGAALQFDYATEEDSTAGSDALGRGFMIGPYIAGKSADGRLSFEGQAMWGRAFNSVTPIGTYTDDFISERTLLRGKVSTQVNVGNWSAAPRANLSYFSEAQPSYVDGAANTVAAQTITLGEGKLGVDFSRSLGDTNLTLGASAVTNFAVSSGSSFTEGDWRGRVDLGLSKTTATGWTLSGSVFVDGLGASAYESYGGMVRAGWEF